MTAFLEKVSNFYFFLIVQSDPNLNILEKGSEMHAHKPEYKGKTKCEPVIAKTGPSLSWGMLGNPIFSSRDASNTHRKQ